MLELEKPRFESRPRVEEVEQRTEHGESTEELAKKLNVLLERLQPEQISPKWISKHGPGIYAKLTRALPDLGGRRDWSPLVEQLDNSWKERWTEQKRVAANRDIETEVADLSTLLEREQPEAFGPTWIQQHDQNLAFRLAKYLHQGDTGRDWSGIVSQLDEKWQKRWARKARIESGRDMRDEIQDLHALLETHGPEKFNPSWIRDHDSPLYFRLVSWSKKESKKIDWSKIIRRLNEKWQERWFVGSEKEIPDFEQDMRQLHTLLEQDDPQAISPSWILKKNRGLYLRLQSSIRNGQGAYDWSRVENSLDERWRERWTAAFRTERGRDLAEEASALTLLLETERPERLYPYWIRQHDHPLFQRVCRTLAALPRDGNGLLNWSHFIALLSAEWQQRWSVRDMELGRELQDDVKDLSVLLERERPEIFDPGWIADRDQTLYIRLRSKSRNQNGDLDWSNMIHLLNADWQSRWSSKGLERSLEVDISNLAGLLSQERPDSFSQSWIRARDPNLYRRLCRKARTEAEQVDWNMVLDRLDPQWQKAWSPELPQTIERDILVIHQILEQEKPTQFGPNWLLKHDRSLYDRLVWATGRNKDTAADWSKIILLLDPQWQERWSEKRWRDSGKQDTWWLIRREIHELKDVLDEKKPSFFYPQWISDQHPQLYRRLCSKLPRLAHGIDWGAAISCLDREWQQRWSVKTQEPGLQKEVEALQKILDAEQPSAISPTWIKKNHENLYWRFRNKARNEAGLLDWKIVSSQLDKTWADRWQDTTRKKIADYLPKIAYRDTGEVDHALRPFQDKLYTFLTLLKPEDSKNRNLICRALIQLAQRGNGDAEVKLISFFDAPLQEWIDQFEDFAIYKYDPEIAREVIRRCIYYFDTNRPESFHAYLFRTLQLRTRLFIKHLQQSLDQPLNGADDLTLYDVLAQAEENSDDE